MKFLGGAINFFSILLLSSIVFSQDTDPPYYYYSEDIEGPSVEFYIYDIADYTNNVNASIYLYLEAQANACGLATLCFLFERFRTRGALRRE